MAERFIVACNPADEDRIKGALTRRELFLPDIEIRLTERVPAGKMAVWPGSIDPRKPDVFALVETVEE